MPAAFQLYRKSQTFFGDDGQEIPGGYLSFFEAGTSTPKHVYANKSMGDGTDNGVTVALDASSRPSLAIWGSGAYDVKIYDADDVQVGEDLQIEIPGGEATALPALDPDKFLTNDGAVMSWEEIREVPDPTGHADQVLSSDGTTLTWIDKPEDGAAGADATNVTSTSTTFSVGDMLGQTGTGTGTNIGGRSQSATVTFATAFDSTPVFIGVQVTNSSLSTGGTMPSWSIATSSTTGCTITFTMGEIDDTRSDFNFNAAVTFKYFALGVKAA